MISELKVTTVSVSDLGRSIAFYRDAFGYVPSAVVSLGGFGIANAWRMPAGMAGRCVVTGPPGAKTGLLRLVQFDSPGPRIWGDYSRARDYGHYALNIRVADINAAVSRLRQAGGRAKSEPAYWTVSPQISAWDCLSYDPDGVLLDVFQILTEPGSPLAEFDAESSELQTVAMHVSDARRSAAFYAALGYVELYDKMVESMESFFGLPPGTALHNINMYIPGRPTSGRVELAQYVGFPGRDQRDRATPPNVGILSASMETDDLAATAAQLTRLGAEPVCEPVELDLPPYGPALVQPFFGLDGEVLEFFQPR